MQRETTGMVLGKFLPPHLGHQYLVDFAAAYCDRVTVLVCSIPSEPIPGELRYQWARRMFSNCDVVPITDDLPQEPADADDFWEQWRSAIRRRIPTGPDFVFASEEYGERLAAELGAEFVIVDADRQLVCVSGTAIRQNPMENWRYIPNEVRPFFVRRVAIVGPESTGKTTLARSLAAQFDTVWVHEYARPLLERVGGVCTYEDIERIARGQAAARTALERQANRVIFCDTDALMTTIWSHELFGRVPEPVATLAAHERYDLTLLCDIDVPFVPDAQRYFADHASRAAFMNRCRDALRSQDRPFVEVSGAWPDRLALATAVVKELLRR